MRKKYSYLKFIVLGILIYIPVFSHLDTLPIQLWDESRLAINAYEMHHFGQYLVTHFDGLPDLWNTKPPLLIWMQVFWMKIIGVNEIALRLPSSLAALLTIISILIFSCRYLKSSWLGIITALILITSYGYVFNHGIRSANYDGLLTLFTTISGLLFYSFIETKKNKFLYGFFITLGLAVLTKSITGLLFGPAFLVYLILRKELIPLLKNKHFYIGLLSFIFLVGGFYITREIMSPGYLEAVYTNELGGRYLETIEHHSNSFWYYFDQLIDQNFSFWYLLVPIGMAIGFSHTNAKIKWLTIYSSILVGVFFLVISVSQTKLSWYDIPLFPFLAIISAVPVLFVFELLETSKVINKKLNHKVLPVIFLFLVFATPYQETIDTVHDPKKYKWDQSFYSMAQYLKDALKNKEDLNGVLYVNTEYMPNNEFYLHLLRDSGIDIVNGGSYLNIQSGDTIIAYQPFLFDYFESQFDVAILYDYKGVKKYQINARK